MRMQCPAILTPATDNNRDRKAEMDTPTATSPVLEVIFTPEAIASRLVEMADAIKADALENLMVVAILKGSFVFAADLIRALHGVGLAPEVDFMTLSSYRKARISGGQVSILRDMDLEVTDRNVMIIDDVLDSGRTLAFAKDLIAARGAKSIRTCVLLDKQAPRAVQLQPDYCAFECPDVFVVGYGMDVAHRYRELPFVGRIVRE
jgi:hypoxanthine phosphoribosyltransferase